MTNGEHRQLPTAHVSHKLKISLLITYSMHLDSQFHADDEVHVHDDDGAEYPKLRL